MTLTVDEVRNIRFPMARQPNEDGYRASAVDNFIDRLEVSYANLVEENDRLRAQPGGDGASQEQLAALSRERDQLLAQVAQQSSQVAQLTAQVGDLTTRLSTASAGDPAMQAHVQQLTQANEELHRQLASASGNPEVTAGLQAQVADLMARITQQGQEKLAVQAQFDELQARTSQEKAALQVQLDEARARAGELQAKLTAGATAFEGDTRPIVVTTSSEAAPAVVLLVEQTLTQAQKLMDSAKVEIEQRRAEAETEARRLVESATLQAEELARRAQSDAVSVQSEASASADRLVNEARGRAAAIDNEADRRRGELYGQLERDRQALTERIGQLRDFETQYRESMAMHLQRQLDSLKDADFAPTNRPELLD